MTEDARQLYREGRTADALAAARKAHDPADPQSGLLLGMLCAVSGEADEADRVLTEALSSGAGEPRHWSALASARASRRDPAGEADALRQAVRLAPGDATYWLRLAAALLDAGQRPEALDALLEALKLDETPTARRLFGETIQGTTRTDPAFREVLKRALAETWAAPTKLHRAAIHVIRAGGLPSDQDDLLAELLRSQPIQDADLELALTAARRRCLLEGHGNPRFMACLAAQCDANEYCWRVSPEEEAALAGLPADDPRRAMYAPANPEPLLDVSVLTPIRAGVSETVMAMYEENPHPRWIRSPPAAPQPLDRLLRAMFPLARIEPIPGQEVLIAGCGTGQHAIFSAQAYEGSRVLAVDLSRASLSYAIRKTAEAGVGNITFGQADLLELPSLGRTFDVIECAGTLHHLGDPAAGLRILTGLLKPGGVIRIGLYSRRARADLAPAMRLARDYEPSTAGIRALRQAIIDAEPGDPVRAAMSWADFYTTSMVRDLLMHVQEHLSEIGDIRRMLEENRLGLLGFVLRPEVLNQYRLEHPDDPAALNLASMERFEARHPEVFRTMYQFWAQKPGAA